MKINDLIKNRYRIIELLGEGGMAFVFKAKDEQLERFVAIKTLKPSYLENENFVTRFKREAQTAANLNHPNIVQIFDWGVEENEPYFVMEFIEGTTLSTVISKNKKINPALISPDLGADGVNKARFRGILVIYGHK